MAACSFCKREIDAGEVAREYEVWEIVRARGHVRRIARKPTGRIACTGCALDLAHGFEPNTPKLL